MLWIDHPNYFGPDRRRSRLSLRWRERRGESRAGNAPALGAALRQLRQHVLEAHGTGLPVFLVRARGTAILASLAGEDEAAFELEALEARLAASGDGDMRPLMYEALNRTHGALRRFH